MLSVRRSRALGPPGDLFLDEIFVVPVSGLTHGALRRSGKVCLIGLPRFQAATIRSACCFFVGGEADVRADHERDGIDVVPFARACPEHPAAPSC